jgi:acetyl-CoA carboxylase alpha subunit
MSNQITDLKTQSTATAVIIAHIQETGEATRADLAQMRKEQGVIQARTSQRLGTIDQWRATVSEWRRLHMTQHEDLKRKSDRLDILNGFLATIASLIAFVIGSNK